MLAPLRPNATTNSSGALELGFALGRVAALGQAIEAVLNVTVLSTGSLPSSHSERRPRHYT
eukprot:SAG11_NODE_5324_length_1595_cov_1.394385_2_plen_61_part_00